MTVYLPTDSRQALGGLTCSHSPSGTSAITMRKSLPRQPGAQVKSPWAQPVVKSQLSQVDELEADLSSCPQPESSNPLVTWPECLLVRIFMIFVIVKKQELTDERSDLRKQLRWLSWGLVKQVILLHWSHLRYTSFIPSATGISNLIPNFLPATFTHLAQLHNLNDRRQGKNWVLEIY